MAEEEVVAVAAGGVEAGADASPVPSDHKRKLEDLEPRENEDEVNAEPQAVPTSEGFSVDLNADSNDVDNSVPDAKRPRLDEDSDVPAAENGHQGEKLDEKPEDKLDEKLEEVLEGKTEEKLDEQLVENQKEQAEKDDQVKNAGNLSEANVGEENAEKPSVDHQETGPAADGQQSLPGDFQQPTEEVPEQRGDLSSAQHQSQSEEETMSRKMEVPNNKVGVLIGKAGDTIRFLQYNSGAKIQITRDAEADRYSSTRPVELIGSLENINKAEKLIKDVIAEADAGGSPSLVARGFGTAPPSGAAEQLLIQVPNEKVGLIIGKGGDTIKNLQTRSGARIQLIPQHLPEGDQSKERTVRVSGDKKQIEVAREMIKDVMDQQPVRASPLSGGNQQGFRPRGPTTGPAQWGGSRSTSTPRGSSYDYPQRGPPSQNPHYPPPSYGGYPSQQSGPRGGNYNSSWDHHRHPGTQPHSSQGGSGYDYYGQGQGGNHVTDHPPSGPASNAGPVHGSGPSSQGNYYGGHPQGGPEYGPPPSYQQTAPPQQQGYGPGYEDPKYANQPAVYGGHGNSQPGGPYSAHQPGNPQPGYNQQPYGNKAPSYGMPPQGGPASQTYGGMTRTGQPAEMPPYQGGPTYGSNMPAQQGYPYGGPTQQSYPPYGSAPATANDGYSQPLPNPASGYPPQQGAHSGYGQQPGVQPTPGYAQGGGQSAGYGPYPSAQPGYTEQPVPTSAGYGYQGIADPGYNNAPTSGYGAPPGGQAGYGQPVPNQTGYEQPIPQPGGAAYSNAPAAAAAPVAGYAKNVSPQPAYPQQFDSTQMYGGHH